MEGLDSGTVELIGAFLTGVVGPVAYYIVSRIILIKREKERDAVKESVEDNYIIEHELENIRQELNADRVWVAQFHNGGTFYPTGKSVQKFSIFYESTSPGISSVARTLRNIPCSLYSKALSKLLKRDDLFIPSFQEKMYNTYGLDSMIEVTGSMSMYILPLFSMDNKFIGMIGVDTIKTEKKLKHGEWEYFHIHAGRISGFLSNYLNKD